MKFVLRCRLYTENTQRVRESTLLLVLYSLFVLAPAPKKTDEFNAFHVHTHKHTHRGKRDREQSGAVTKGGGKGAREKKL